MKFRLILTGLLLPCVVAAQQPAEKPKAEPPTVTDLQYSVVLPADRTQYLFGDNSFAPQEQSKVRVNLNLRNAPLKEAVKQLGEQTKEEFVLESDVPADARVTIVAKNIRLNTALDMLTDATDLKWAHQRGLKWEPNTAKKPGVQGSSSAYHIGKNVSQYRSNIYWSVPTTQQFNLPNDYKLFYTNPKANDSGHYYPYETLPKLNRYKNDAGKTFDVAPLLKGSQNLKPDGDLTPRNFDTSTLIPNLQGNKTLLSDKVAYTLNNSLVGLTTLSETRSTFTCPNCKHQVTVIHKHEAPKCEKCGRVFHDDWQFCPFDGATRPAVADADWLFCPICGKSTKTDGKAEAKPVKP